VALRPIAGTTDLLEWTWPSLPPSPFAFSYALGVPESYAWDKQVLALAALQSADRHGADHRQARPAD
jgi:hypothetical protein